MFTPIDRKPGGLLTLMVRYSPVPMEGVDPTPVDYTMDVRWDAIRSVMEVSIDKPAAGACSVLIDRWYRCLHGRDQVLRAIARESIL